MNFPNERQWNQSQTAEAISGVPQGYVIGPILFVIYVNDLPDRLSVDSLPCADDVKLIVHIVLYISASQI